MSNINASCNKHRVQKKAQRRHSQFVNVSDTLYMRWNKNYSCSTQDTVLNCILVEDNFLGQSHARTRMSLTYFTL